MTDMSERTDATAVANALAFLAGHPHVFLLTRRADGLPTAYAMTARVDGDSVLFSTYGASAKVANLLRTGTARVLAADEDGGTTVVEAGGPVRLVEASRWLDPDAAASGGGTPGSTGAVPAEVVEKVRNRHESGKRVVVELRVTHVRSGQRLP